MKTRKFCVSASLVLAVLFMTITSGAVADEEKSWEFTSVSYQWLAGFGGETASGEDFDIDFDDVFDALNFAFMTRLEARYGKWSIGSDVVYVDLEEDVGGLVDKVELQNWVVTPTIGYTVLEAEQGRLDLYAGARYLYMKSTSKVYDGPVPPRKKLRFTDSSDFWDGIVGIRGQINLSEKWYLPCALDVGAGDSDFTWQVFGGVGYRFRKCDLIVGYRYLEWDFGEANDALDVLNIGGPVVGLKFRF